MNYTHIITNEKIIINLEILINFLSFLDVMIKLMENKLE